MKVFTNGSGCHFKENIRSSAKDLDCELFYSELKRHNVSHYIYYLAADNIPIVLENDNTRVNKDLKVVNVKPLKTFTSYKRLWLKSENHLLMRKSCYKQAFSMHSHLP